MKKTCEHIEPELSAYIFDELDPPARTEIEEHLAACENCRKELTDLRATLGALEEKFHATPVAAELSPERVNAIRENATSESLTEKRSANVVSIGVKRHPILWTLGMAAAAMLLVVPVVNESMKPEPLPRMILPPISEQMEAHTSKRIESTNKMRAALGQVPLTAEEEAAIKDRRNTAIREGETQIAMADAEESGLSSPGYDLNATSTDPATSTGYPGHALSEVGGAITEVEGEVSKRPSPTRPNWTVEVIRGEKRSPQEVTAGAKLDAGNTESERGRANSAKAKAERQIASLPTSAAASGPPPNAPMHTDPGDMIVGDAEQASGNNVHHFDDAVDLDRLGYVGSSAPAAPSKAEARKSIDSNVEAIQASEQSKNLADSTASDSLERGAEDEIRRANLMIARAGVAGTPESLDASRSLARSAVSLYDAGDYVEAQAVASRVANDAEQLGFEASAGQAAEPEPARQLGRTYEVADAPQEQLRRYEPPQSPPAHTGFYYQQPPQDMTFQDYGVNPFVQTQADPLSTFSMDVDTGSFTVARNYLNRNTAPPPAAIRVEEILNYFPAPYPAPKESDFAVYGEMAPSPFGQNLHLLKIGIKGREMQGERKPVVLTFVIDVSGSMSQENRLGLVQRTLTYLAGFMRPEDQIGIAVYGTNGREVLAHTPGSNRATILNAINSLRSEGSTNAAEGLLIGYGMARRAFNAGGINRVVLCSDGVANTGVTDAAGILDLIGQAANDRIYLTSLGVGMGNYNDTLMEQLADKGNGHYAYLDGDQEAQRYVSRELVSAMEVIAQDTKIQVEFNAEVVKQYRLIGFENRNVADADFRNDKVDAGEIGTGHAVTALYEVELAQGAEAELAATVRVRYKQPDKEMKAKEIAGKLKLREIMKTFEASEPHMKLVAIAAEYAEILRNSYWSRGSDMGQVAALFDRTFPGNPPGPEAGELRGLIDIASRVAWNRPAPVPPIGVIPNEPKPEPFPGEPGNAIPMEELGYVTP